MSPRERSICGVGGWEEPAQIVNKIGGVGDGHVLTENIYNTAQNEEDKQRLGIMEHCGTIKMREEFFLSFGQE